MNKKNDDLRQSIKQALQKAAHYCAYRERCMKETRQKLYDLKLDSDDVEEVIYLLIKNNFLNEERYAKIYCRSKFNQNRWGKNKIIQHLKSNEISVRNISTGLKEIDAEEYVKVLQQLLERKKDGLKDKNIWVRKKKLSDFALQRGFEYELIKEFL